LLDVFPVSGDLCHEFVPVFFAGSQDAPCL
jgi:hypothetical protein